MVVQVPDDVGDLRRCVLALGENAIGHGSQPAHGLRHVADVALIKTREEGLAMAQPLGAHYAVFLANHDDTFCGTSVEHATCVGVFLEHAYRAHVAGAAAGFKATMPERATREKRQSQMMTAVHVEHTWAYLERKLASTLAGRGEQAVLYR